MASFKFIPPSKKGAVARARFHWRIGPDQYNKTIPITDLAAAERRKAMIEEILLDVMLGKRLIPPGVEVVDYVLSGGACAAGPTKPSPAPVAATLGDLVTQYQASVVKDSATRYTEDIHLSHILRVIGAKKPLAAIDLGDAQTYANRRRKETSIGRTTPTRPTTILKELKTLSIVWNWVAKRPGAMAVPKGTQFDISDVELPAEDPKPPFRTWEEIKHAIERGGLSQTEIHVLWESLYLTKVQTTEVLAQIEPTAPRPFLHPMLCAAAYTGARRSELCRSLVDDWDLDGRSVHIRQKKNKDRSQKFSFRNIDISTALLPVMRRWFESHPGGQFAFCQAAGDELRPYSATYFLNAALSGTEWHVIKGWHTFRHSFASNLARAGVDQRIIDSWMGHHTDIRLRYQHLFPDQRRDAIESLVN